MKFLLTVPIRLYWKFVPVTRRRQCIHRVSCSQHVYGVTMKEGLISGIRALFQRMKTCRGGYEMTVLDNRVILVLRNGDVLQEEEIAEGLVRGGKKQI